MFVFKICPNFIIQIYQPFIISKIYLWCFQTPLQPLQWENTNNCGRWVERCGGFGSFIWSVYVSALGCGTADCRTAMVDCLCQWTRAALSLQTVSRVPVMVVISTTGASADLLRSAAPTS